jgi:hypothetical protein
MKLHIGFRRSGALLALIAFALAAMGAIAQERPAARQTASEGAPAAHRPGGEGLKIHGHWKIEVRNPDGTLVKTYEFENSLVTPGAADEMLSGLFSGTFTQAGWSVVASSTNPTTLCPTNGIAGANNSCTIVPALGTNTVASGAYCVSYACFGGLTAVGVPANLTTNTSSYLQLQGSFTPTASGSVTSVQTNTIGCTSIGTNPGVSTVTISQCYNGLIPGTMAFISIPFTAATLSTPVNVLAGQLVTITVNISFS